MMNDIIFIIQSQLLNLDKTSYNGGKHGKNYPGIWCREFKKSKMFYTALEHTEESFQDETYLQHLLEGILYVLANIKPIK